jgi:hypothetical protein
MRRPRGVGITAWSPPQGVAGCNKEDLYGMLVQKCVHVGMQVLCASVLVPAGKVYLIELGSLCKCLYTYAHMWCVTRPCEAGLKRHKTV